MSKTWDDIWGSDRNIFEKFFRSGYAGLGKVRQIFGDSKGAHDMYEQANPREDWDKTGTYFDGTPREDTTLKAPTFAGAGPAVDDNYKKPTPIPTYNPYAAQQARDNALKLASINDSLSRMPSQLNRINQAEQNKYSHIEDTFNRANHGNETGWNMYKEDHDRAVKNRLDNRRRQIGIADDDFKKQRDAYSRYFSRTGSGSSSTAQFSVPTLLARASQKIRNDIEKENADSAIEQETAFNRANFDYRKNKENILTERNRQRNAAKEDFDTRRSGYWDEVGRLERQKADVSNRSVADIMAAGRDATSKANRYADDAVKAGNLTEEIKFKPIEYHQAQQKDFTYDPTKTKVENPEEPKTDESLYNKYFRDEEEKKKKKGWITGVGA